MKPWLARKLIRAALHLGRAAKRLVGSHRYQALVREECPVTMLLIDQRLTAPKPITWN